MSLTFSNQYPATVSISILWYSPGCSDGGDWELAGWYNLGTGQSMTVFFGDLADINRYWYFNAEAVDGAYWAGSVRHEVPDTAFDWCWNTGSTNERPVGFREIDVGDADDYTLTLVG
ncbi:MAG TPA: DUF1036 domain-containing protein [Methylocella sp.]|nr:DUF1036 domain-containing protein [Methylocella sp.]